MSVRFTCTTLVGTNKKGVLPPDENGYRTMAIGGLNVVNSAGQYYTAAGAKDLFESSSAFQRRVRRGVLRSEVGHPKRTPGQGMDEYMQRVLCIDERNVCAHISEVSLDFENYVGPEGPIVAIVGKVAPSGPFADMLERMFNNGQENVCFSIRAFTSDYMSRGITHRVLKNIITFDYVNEPGIAIAEKYKSPALESFEDSIVTQSQLVRATNSDTAGAAMESISLSAPELFTSLGWATSDTKPVYTKW